MGVTAVATVDGAPVENGAATDELQETYDLMAIEYTRSLVSPIPGAGPTRGVWYYNGVTYAFRNNDLNTECRMYRSLETGWELVTTPVLAPDGRYEFINANFGGHAGTLMMYGVDGKNKGFQFDGTTFTQITTGMTDDTPTHLYEHKKQLFYAFSGGSVQHAAPGTPLVWSAITGAAELAIGDEITGFSAAPGDVLSIHSRNSTHLLYGTSVSDWNLKPFNKTVGAIPYTLQQLSYPIFLDDRGLTYLQAVQDYGDFRSKTLSQKIQPILDSLKTTVTGSVRIRGKDQYRLYFSDKTFLTFSFDNEKLIGVTRGEYDVEIRVPVSVEDEDGNELFLFGCTGGFVYRGDSGRSLDGEAIVAWIRPIFNHFKSPQNVKRFFKVVLEIDAQKEATLSFVPEFSYGDVNLPRPIEGDITVDGGGSFWDSGVNWDQFYYESQIISTAYGYIDAQGTNFSLFIRSESVNEPPHTIQGAIVHYSIRGVKR